MLFRRITRHRACPECHSRDIHRVKRVGLTVKALCRIFDVRPHVCADCDNFFLAPRQPKPASSSPDYNVSGGNHVGHHSHPA